MVEPELHEHHTAIRVYLVCPQGYAEASTPTGRLWAWFAPVLRFLIVCR